ncbi:YggS family pyridoxal phosphate-dependent enzyme [Oceanobacillus indicireducens]|uniref:Pyridoxal phosphate homeostasis protein n=1 Tax=Oceanobacillus indicireducens TaxID=1004261 RepID=A0A917XRW1_9BACI|nr:YggS family pyridoxal phosphate-dependent enzyme [Oceanobacillus indicireducens]GGN49349.1 YggS family pyridoxal phosphate enzyme [Oceanobacillus indicireducens]
MVVATNLEEITNHIAAACERSNRKKEDISLIAVTKYVTIERNKELVAAGIKDFGENRTEGFLEKYEAVGEDANWHFIGTLQSRKVKDIIDKVDMIHSLDRISLAKEINKRATEPIDCFVQVNVSEEETKHGLKVEEVEDFIKEIEKYDKVRVVGLMTMAPHVEDRELIRRVFRELATLRDTIRDKKYAHAPCHYLSMGMSNDYEIAIEEGATHIRIGSKLVGE